MNIECYGSGSSGNSYLVYDGNTSILIDAGVNPKKIAKKIGWKHLSKIDACLITHEHQDHAKYVWDLLDLGIDCYMTAGTKKALNILKPLESKRIHRVTKNRWFKIEDWDITGIENLHHDAASPVFFRIQNDNFTLVYITDTGHLPDVKGMHINANYLMIEANYDIELLEKAFNEGNINAKLYKRIIGSHLSIDAVVKWLAHIELTEVKEIHLMHLSDTHSNAADFKKRVQQATGIETYIEGGNNG